MAHATFRPDGQMQVDLRAEDVMVMAVPEIDLPVDAPREHVNIPAEEHKPIDVIRRRPQEARRISVVAQHYGHTLDRADDFYEPIISPLATSRGARAAAGAL